MNAHSENTISRFINIFDGYTKAYGTYVAKGTSKDGKAEIKAETVSEPATPALFQAHLDGTKPLGILPLDDDQRVRWAVIDIDTYPIDHTQLVERIRDLKLPLVVCRSKSGGAHCFLFLSEPSDPVVVRSYMMSSAAALGYPKAEVFPKQTQRKEGETGNWLNLPYFYAKRSERYCVGDGMETLSLEEFLGIAEATATTISDLTQLDVPVAENESAITPAEAKRFVLPDVIPERGTEYGGRDNTLFRYGCSLQAKGWDDDAITEELQRTNIDRCDPPLPRRDMDRIIKQALKYPKGNPLPDWVEELNDRHAVVAEAGKARVLNTRDYDPTLKRRMLTHSTFGDFKNLYCNQYAQIGTNKDGEPIYAAKGEAWLKHPARRQYNGTIFAPGQETPGWFNAWQGFSVEPRPGDWSLLQDHIRTNVTNGNREHYDYLLGWMAFAVQRPDIVPEVAVVLLGGRGVGKGVLVNAHGSMMHEHYLPLSNPEHITGRFNAHLRDTAILFLDEAFWAGDQRGEGTLKRLITDSYMPVEKKGIDVSLARSYLHIWVASNDAWAVPAGVDERRFFVLDVADHRKQDHTYFEAIARQLDNGGREAMLYDLLHLDLTGFNPRAAPMTPALFRQKIHSMDKKTKWWFEALWNGEIPNYDAGEDDDGGGWRTTVIKDSLYRSYLDHSGDASTRAHRGTQTELGMFLSPLMPERWAETWNKRAFMTKWLKDPDGGNSSQEIVKVPAYELPDLETCRKCFDAKIRSKTDWPVIEDDGAAARGDRRSSHIPDEDFPF